MHITHIIRPQEQSPEKQDFEQAKQESQAARQYARESIDLARKELQLTWLEDALIPVPPKRRRTENWLN